MRVVFLGTPRAAATCLRALAASRHRVAAVLCQPDRPAGRGMRATAPAVKDAALELGLPVLQPETTGGAALRAEVAALKPDALVVVAYGRLLGPKFRALAPHGAINVHFSMLPRWRGAAPVQRALLAGDRVTGVSTMRLVQELDAGPILERAEVAITPGEHAPALEARLADLGASLLLTTLDGLEAGTLHAAPQDEALVTHAAPLAKEESHLDPRRPAEELARRTCALDPWPGTRLVLADGVHLGVLEARVGEGHVSESPGTFLAPRGEALPLACGGGTLLLLDRVKPAGKAAMTGRSAVNGRHVHPGDVAVAEAPTSSGSSP